MYITVFFYSVCDNQILDVGLHGWTFLRGDQRSHLVLYVRVHELI